MDCTIMGRGRWLAKVYRYCGGVHVRRRNGSLLYFGGWGIEVGDVQVDTGGTVGTE
jgi:hypothetical protein